MCARLATHLVHHGHLIPDWIQRGCDEDWGVYLESTTDDARFQYHICFFPGPADASQNQMLIQYNLQPHRANLPPDHSIHRTMQSFGNLFSGSRMLTKSQFEAEY